MSRYTLPHVWEVQKKEMEEFSNFLKDNVFEKLPKVGSHRVVYGWDHACGYFFQFERVDIEYEEDYLKFIELDYLFDGLTGAETGTILQKLNRENNPTVSLHTINAFMDLEF
jgi:hypothetical protein